MYSTRRRFFPVLLVILLVLITIIIYCLNETFSQQNFDHFSNGHDIHGDFFHKLSCNSQRQILTAKGRLSYSFIDEHVFRTNGYRIFRNCTPFPMLEFIAKPNCDDIFKKAITIANRYNSSMKPPKSIPINLKSSFLLGGYTTLVEEYSDNSFQYTLYNPFWTDVAIARLLHESNENIAAISSYGVSSNAIDHATKKFSILGKTGLVIGSIRPWIEIICLNNGAKKIVTAVNTKFNVADRRLEHVLPDNLARNWKSYKFDFVVSYSSLEHSGLGRFGDPIDPIGDLREMLKIGCLLEHGGLVFVGVPTGQDSVVFNLHRVYGVMRLSMMFTGLKLLDVFDGTNPDGMMLQAEMLEHNYPNLQLLFVLEKF